MENLSFMIVVVCSAIVPVVVAMFYKSNKKPK